MRWFPDFSALATRAFTWVVLPCLAVGAFWMVQLSATSLDEPDVTSNSAEPAEGEHAASGSAETDAPTQALATLSQRWWLDYVPAEVRAHYELPSSEQVRTILVRLERELQDGSVGQLASYEREARRALRVLRRSDGGEVLASWLEPRVDFLRAAAQLETTPLARRPEVLPQPAPPLAPEGPSGVVDDVLDASPQFTRGYWDRVLVRRRPPSRAPALVPRLKETFAAAGVPPQLVWIAEVESAMNPEATSPVGARGLFQFMPLTAARFGLETGVLLDERTDPEKSARAAAEYLRVLHRRFRSWPLALAAYNAGEGRVGRALAAERVTSFDAVAHRLPLETRLYVPKVLATVAARESIDPELLPEPGAAAQVNDELGSGADAVPPASGETGGTASAVTSL